MAESPNPLPSSERARQLAERFGMTREAVDSLLSATHTEYSAESLPPVQTLHEAPIERAAQNIPPPSSPAVAPATTDSHAKPLSGGVIAGIFIALFIGLGIALSFRDGCFNQRAMHEAAKPVDTVQRMLDSASEQASAPRTPTQVAPGELPPESVTIPQEEPPGTSGPSTNPSHKAAGTNTQASPKALFTSTSEYQAQEKLAELRADGNTHARIHANRKGGSVTYQVTPK